MNGNSLDRHDGDPAGYRPSQERLEASALARQIADSASIIQGLSTDLETIREIATAVCRTIEGGGKVLTCGNGGSALEAQHFASELISHFKRDRPALPAVSLPLDHGVITAIANDYSYAEVFERQISALAGPDDLVIGFTTSGDSENVVRALAAARSQGATTVVLMGGRQGRAAAFADLVAAVPSEETARIQEAHLVLTHLICDEIDAYFTP